MKIIELIKKADAPFFSLEFFPPAEDSSMENFYKVAEDLKKLNPLFVSVTYGAGGSKQDKSMAVLSGLAERGFTAMAHLTCIGTEPAEIGGFLSKLQAAGVDNILALRGDMPQDSVWDKEKAYFKYAIDLVKFIKKEFPAMGIAVAAYPAPHPESATFEEDRHYTIEKIAAGADFALTQLFFDNREYMAFVGDMRKRGIDIPVIPGIMPIQSLAGLKKILSLCGASVPARFYLELEDANERGGNAAVRETGIKFALRQIKGLLDFGAPGIHLYTLNKSELCTYIVKESGLG